MQDDDDLIFRFFKSAVLDRSGNVEWAGLDLKKLLTSVARY